MENTKETKKYTWLFIIFLSLLVAVSATMTSMTFSYVTEKGISGGIASGVSLGIAFGVTTGAAMRLGIAKPTHSIIAFASKTGLDKYIFQSEK